MKNRILSLILAFIMIVSLLPTTVVALEFVAYDSNTSGAQDVAQKFRDGEVLSVAHRGAWRYGPENSLLAIAAAIELGVDVVEVDVALTKDKVLVLSHDETVNRCVSGVTGKVSDYTWEELSGMSVEPSQGGSDKVHYLSESDVAVLNGISGYAEHCGGPATVGGTLPLTRMDDAVELINHRVMINLDKCTNEEIFVACYILFRETDMLDHVFFKNSVNAATLASWCQSAAEAWNEKYPEESLTKEDVQESFIYVYVLSSSNTAVMQAHLDAGNPLKMVEMVIENDKEDTVYEQVDEVWCRENGIALFVNTMWSGLAGTRPDSETCWAEMIDRGYTAIQTDRPGELARYLKNTQGSRAATDRIEAEHFTTFSYEGGFRLSLPAAADANGNKTVDGMGNGEWLAYDNIVFDGEEVLLNLSGYGLDDTARVQIYLDEMTDDGLLAETALPVGTAPWTQTITLKQSVSAGRHTVYVKANGALYTDLASLDSFTFVGGDSMVGAPKIDTAFVITECGDAPKMPETVKVNYENTSYDMQVTWEDIPVDAYAAEGRYTVLGYVEGLRDYIHATVIVVAKDQEITAEYADVEITCDVGEAPALPSKVSAVYSDGTTADIAVTWESVDPRLYITEGTFTVKGVAENGDTVVAYITVVSNNAEDFDDLKENMLVWFSASDLSGEGDALVSEWKEASGNADASAVQTNVDNQPSLVVNEEGKTVGVYFDGSDKMTFAMNEKDLLNGLSEATVIVYSKPEKTAPTTVDTNHNSSVIYFNEYGAGWGGMYMGTYTNGAAGRFGNGVTNHRGILYSGGTYGDHTTAVMIKNSRDSEVLAINGEVITDIKTAAGSASAMTANIDATKGLLGQGKNNTYWKGTVSEIMIFDHALTESELELVYDYLDTTYTDQSAEVAEDGLLLWLDGSEGLNQTDGAVTQWTNKADTTQSATVKRGTPKYAENAVNGKPGVIFDGSSSLQLTLDSDAFNGLDGVTIIAYGNTQTPFLTNDQTANGGSWRAQRCTLIYAAEKGSWGSLFMGVYTDYISARIGTGTTNDNGYYKARQNAAKGYGSTAVVWDGSAKTYTVLVDGKSEDSAASLGTVSKNNSNVLYIGEGKDADTYGGWNGTLTELLIYDRALSESELLHIENYFEEKYTSDKAPVYAEGVYLREAEHPVELEVGEEYSLSASTVPANADTPDLIWESSAPEVVSVDENGRITANKIGYAVITVTTKDGGFRTQCTVCVAATEADDLLCDIGRLVAWADGCESADYIGWAAMADAVASARGLTTESSVETLREVYTSLREAKMGLSVKGHVHTWGDNSYVTDEPTEEEPGRILRNCVVCRHALERKLYSDGTEADVHVMGDGNNDGTVNIIDVTLAARYIAQRGVTGDFDLSECDIEMFDVNSDGTIDQLDLNGIAAIIRNN